MSLIFIPEILTSKTNQTYLQGRNVTPISTLSIGEVLETGVIEKLADHKMLIDLKGIVTQADSEVRLNAGDRIQVKVESLSPQLVLRILESSQTETSDIVDYLRWHRSNPEALSQMMTEVVRQLSPDNLGKLFPRLPGDDLTKILTILRSLLFSPETKGNDFLKTYLDNLGITLESQLRQAAEDGTEIGAGRTIGENLKGLLIGLSEDVNNLLEKRNSLEHEEAFRLADLSRSIDSSIKTIESHQVVNLILQEAESKYLFQVPLLFPDGIRKGDIFIEYDRNPEGRRGNKGCYRVIFFLSMDVLGDMIIEAELKGEKIGCVVKCANQNSCDFALSFLEELRRNLCGLGCHVDRITCVVSKDLATEKMDYLKASAVYEKEAVNIFV